jgi:signal transduction histidine kinase
MTLRLRLSMLVTLVALLAMVCFGSLAYYLFIQDQNRQLTQLLNRDIERAQSLFANPAVGTRLSLSQGVFLQQFVSTQNVIVIPPDATIRLPLYTQPKHIRIDDIAYLVSSRPWKLSSGIELGTVRVSLDIREALRFRRSLLRSLFLSGFLITLLALGIGLGLLKRALQPLLNLAEEAKALDPSNPTMAAHYTGPNDEVAQVARALNSALEGIRHRQQAQRESLADIAHELSAPLMVVSGHLESLAKQRNDPRLDAAREAADELLYTAQDLLTLARGELEQRLELSIVDLSDIVERVARAFPGIAIDLAKAQVAGNPERLTQLLRNLVRNGIQAAGDAEKVSVKLEAGVTHHHVTVQDQGPGMAPDEVSQIFKRFYSKRGGAGLGLAIAKQILDQHGGDIRVSSVVGQGTLFTVILPSLDSKLDQE